MDQKSDALKLVLEKNDDVEQIKIAWQLCHNERLKLLNELSTFEYMRRFPAYDLPIGYELVHVLVVICNSRKSYMIINIFLSVNTGCRHIVSQ